MNGKTYKNWEEYIIDKFPNAEFDILENEEQGSKVFTISLKDLSSKTNIVFYFSDHFGNHVTYHNPGSVICHFTDKNKILGVPLYFDEINEESLEDVDDYIAIPLYFGWTEKFTQFNGRQIKSEILYFDNILWRTISIEQNISWYDKTGCLLTLFAWPILHIQHRFVHYRLNRKDANVKTTLVEIQPMKKQIH